MKGSSYKMGGHKTKATMESPLPQKLSVSEKLSAAGGVFDVMHPESDFVDLYNYYKTGKENIRKEKRRSKERAGKMNKAAKKVTVKKNLTDKQ